MNKNKNSDAHYRRGIVLGLTFAELLMLLLFVVLLVLGISLKRSGANLNDKSAKSSYSEEELSQMKALNDLLKDKNEDALAQATKLMNEGQQDKAYKTLMGQGLASDNLTALKVNHQELTQLHGVVAYIKTTNPTSYAKIQRYILSGDTEKAYQELIESSNAFKKITQEVLINKSVISDCKAQNKHLVNINNVGRGGDFPSCWFDEKGSKQFIYHVDLTDKGIVVHDIFIESRQAEKKTLPLKGFVFEKAIQSNEFIKAGQQIKKYSDENNCRFFVKISDKTSPQNKEHYKKLRSSVENIFYKKDV